MKTLKELILSIRTQGLTSTIGRIAFRLGRLHTFQLFSLDLTGEVPAPFEVDGAVIREMPVEELRAWRAGRQGLPIEFFRDQVAPGERCFAASFGGEVAYVAWISRTGSSGFMPIGPGEAEVNYLHCRREFRGRRLTSAVLNHLAAALRKEGFRKLWMAIHSENIASIKAVAPGGYRHVADARRFWFLQWRRSAVPVPAPCVRQGR